MQIKNRLHIFVSCKSNECSFLKRSRHWRYFLEGIRIFFLHFFLNNWNIIWKKENMMLAKAALKLMRWWSRYIPNKRNRSNRQETRDENIRIWNLDFIALFFIKSKTDSKGICWEWIGSLTGHLHLWINE